MDAVSSMLSLDATWDPGWMHDTLADVEQDPDRRRPHHQKLTCGSLRAASEMFTLPLSHDDVLAVLHLTRSRGRRTASVCRMAAIGARP